MTSLETVRARFTSSQGLPFAEVLTEASILDVLDEHGVEYRDRVFSPVTTIWGFLSQVLSDDHSCRDAVSRVIAHRAASGLEPCSPNTASYCNARSRLPTGVLRTLAKRTAQQLQDGLPRGVEVERAGRVHRRRLARLHARHASRTRRPTRSRRRSSRASASRWPGSPCCCRWPPAPATTWPSRRTRARAPARPRCLRQMYDSLEPGDVVVADALFDNYFLACELRQRGIELVARAQCRARGHPDGSRAGPTATSSSGSGPTSRAA